MIRLNPASLALFVLLLAVCSVGCASSNTRVVTTDNIADQLGAGGDMTARLDDLRSSAGDQRRWTWLNLCDRRVCDSTKLSYSQLFRDAAVISATIFEIQTLAARVTEGQVSADLAEPILLRAFGSFDELEARAESLLADASTSDPGDLDRKRQRLAVRRELKRVEVQLTQALEVMRTSEVKLAQLLDERIDFDPIDVWSLVQPKQAPLVTGASHTRGQFARR